MKHAVGTNMKRPRNQWEASQLIGAQSCLRILPLPPFVPDAGPNSKEISRLRSRNHPKSHLLHASPHLKSFFISVHARNRKLPRTNLHFTGGKHPIDKCKLHFQPLMNYRFHGTQKMSFTARIRLCEYLYRFIRGYPIHVTSLNCISIWNLYARYLPDKKISLL